MIFVLLLLHTPLRRPVRGDDLLGHIRNVPLLFAIGGSAIYHRSLFAKLYKCNRTYSPDITYYKLHERLVDNPHRIESYARPMVIHLPLELFRSKQPGM